jgi:SAM-dependent methyltransferase
MLSLNDLWTLSAVTCGAPLSEYSKPRGYLDYYEKEFAELRSAPLKIVEVGVFRGQFLETLAGCFPNASIVGIDFQIDRVRVENPRITLVTGDQGDAAGLDEIFRRHAAEGIDIVIDDASHVASLTKSFYDVAIRWLKPGGRYYIEDWGTGYWPTWVDGAEIRPPQFEGVTTAGFPARLRSHDAGMAGFIKSLVDGVGAPEALGTPALGSMSLWAGVVKLVKAA